MAIVQISRITHRKGLGENLPQLAGAEFGWVIDERKLYIGNGTLQEGAPAIGNTEILTEYSDILNIANTYTYKGDEAGYTVRTGPTSGDPVTRTLQNKLDDFASVRDFGATGDGTTDDTVAINRALQQLFCEQTNTEIRRSLFFPAGTYRVTGSINIPPFAKLYGEGSASSIIKLDVTDGSAVDYVARTADSQQQIGNNIGTDATAPQSIELVSMSFESDELADIFLVEDAVQISFSDVNFVGPLSNPTGDAENIACVRFASTAAITCSQVTFDKCKFSGCTYGFKTDDAVEGLTVSNSKFESLYKGAEFGTGTLLNGGPNGVRLVHNLFDAIAQEGIRISKVDMCISGYNVFLDVGNNYDGINNPATSIVVFESDNNVSVGDMFERSEVNNRDFPRINVNSNKVFALDNGERYKFGTYQREAGQQASLSVTGSPTEIFRVNTGTASAFCVKYKFTESGGGAIRFGTLNVVSQDSDDSSGSLTYTDEYSENNPTGLLLSAEQIGSETVSIKYTATTVGAFNYSFDHLG